MSYAVYHCEKGTSSSGGIGKHIDREVGCEYSYQHADPEKKDLNVHYSLNKFCLMSLNVAIEEKIKEGYSGTREIRKDAVKYTTHILTGSHEKMKEIEKDPEQLQKWITRNRTFLEGQFGKNNIVRFTLHRDEKTPHIHAVTVNLTEDGRMSAKEIIGNKSKMQLRQDIYAEAMKEFGLERGKRNTGIKHEDARTYYGRIQATTKIGESNIDDFTANKMFLGAKVGVDKDMTIKNLQDALITQKTALEAQKREMERIKGQNEIVKKNADESFQKFDLMQRNEKYRNELLEKKISQIRFSIKNELDSELRRSYSWNEFSAERRTEVIHDISLKVGKSAKIDQGTYNKLFTKEFESELNSKMDKRVKLCERLSSNRKQDRKQSQDDTPKQKRGPRR